MLITSSWPQERLLSLSHQTSQRKGDEENLEQPEDKSCEEADEQRDQYGTWNVVNNKKVSPNRKQVQIDSGSDGYQSKSKQKPRSNGANQRAFRGTTGDFPQKDTQISKPANRELPMGGHPRRKSPLE